MTAKIVVILGSGQLGPFDDRETASAYLDRLGIEGELVSLTTPPPMSDLLITALTFVRKHGDAPDLFVEKTGGIGSDAPLLEKTLRETFRAAVELYEAAFKLSDQQLALKLLRENDWKHVAAIKALRVERPMGLWEARDVVQQAHRAWFGQ
jgi:hypothetical protein